MWEKYGRAGLATDDSIIWRKEICTCNLDAAQLRPKRINILIILNNFFYSTAKIVKRMRLKVTLHLYCLSCLILKSIK